MKISGIGDPLEWIRAVAEPVHPNPPRALVCGDAGCMRSDDLDLVTASRRSFRDSGDEGAGGVTFKARIVVGDREDPQGPIR
jgi:hypothetical protein